MRCVRLAVLAVLVLAATPGDVPAEVWVYRDPQGRLHFSDAPRHRGFERLAPQARPRVRSQRKARRDYDSLIRQAGRHHGVNPALIKAVVHAESRFDATAVSHAGAQGLMQLMPGTARSLGVDDPFNPWQNIDGGTRYLRYLMARFEGDLNLTLAAYNAGEGTVRRYGGIPPYRVTRRYVQRVLDLYRRYGSQFDVDPR